MLAFIFANLVLIIYFSFFFIVLVFYLILNFTFNIFPILVIRKRFEKASDGNRSEFEEHYGFLIENEAQVYDICNNGYHCMETSFNVLGKYIYI